MLVHQMVPLAMGAEGEAEEVPLERGGGWFQGYLNIYLQQSSLFHAFDLGN